MFSSNMHTVFAGILAVSVGLIAGLTLVAQPSAESSARVRAAATHAPAVADERPSNTPSAPTVKPETKATPSPRTTEDAKPAPPATTTPAKPPREQEPAADKPTSGPSATPDKERNPRLVPAKKPMKVACRDDDDDDDDDC
jgi:outer membrane biosynthesis protein TonB